jgi:hypothetical protein
VKLGKNTKKNYRKEYKKKLSLEMKHGVINMILKANNKVFAMETADIPTTQESLHVKITNEYNDHHFLRYQGYCSF